MSQIYYAAGYGLKVDDIVELLKPEYNDLCGSEIVDEVNKIKETMFCHFNGDEDYIYIAAVSPYEEAPFKNLDQIDKYFFNRLLPVLKEGTTVEQLSEILDDIFDWDYC